MNARPGAMEARAEPGCKPFGLRLGFGCTSGVSSQVQSPVEVGGGNRIRLGLPRRPIVGPGNDAGAVILRGSDADGVQSGAGV